MAAGHLAPDELVTRAVVPALEGRAGYVLDGYPRTLSQAGGLDFDAVVYLNVPDDEVEERLLARGRDDDTPEAIAERLRQYARTPSRSSSTTATCSSRSTATVPRTRSPPSSRTGLRDSDQRRQAGDRAGRTAQRLDEVLDERVALARAHGGEDLPRGGARRAAAARRRPSASWRARSSGSARRRPPTPPSPAAPGSRRRRSARSARSLRHGTRAGRHWSPRTCPPSR